MLSRLFRLCPKQPERICGEKADAMSCADTKLMCDSCTKRTSSDCRYRILPYPTPLRLALWRGTGFNNLNIYDMTKRINKKLEELKEVIKQELDDDVTAVKIFINAQGVDMNIYHRTPEELRREGISMRNIKGDFIE